MPTSAFSTAATSGWQQAFGLLLQYGEDTETYRAGVARIAALLEDWNGVNLGDIQISEDARALIERVKNTQ